MNRFPQIHDYQAAVQNPHPFKDETLNKCLLKKDQFGLPSVSPGRFALTYRRTNPGTGEEWAIRCFRSSISDRAKRYEAIHQWVTRSASQYVVPISYTDEGILCNGSWYPITKMPWIAGSTLDVYIEHNIRNSQNILSLADKFQNLITNLERHGVAHGDLQHGNILVTSDGNLKLVDYDGMFVPALAGWQSNERGLSSYQHPARETEFDATIDRFSAIVLYLTLHALAAKPELLATYCQGGTNLLFQRTDFINPAQSPLLRDLEKIPPLSAFIPRFRSICTGRLQDVPTLNSFLENHYAQPQQESRTYSSVPPVDEIIIRMWVSEQGEDSQKVLKKEGERIEIIGRVASVKRSKTLNGDDCYFLNFGDFRTGVFAGVVWSDGLRIFEKQQVNLEDYNNCHVSITGWIRHYDVENYKADEPVPRPEIVINTPSQIKKFNTQQEAKAHLKPTVHSQQANPPMLSHPAPRVPSLPVITPLTQPAYPPPQYAPPIPVSTPHASIELGLELKRDGANRPYLVKRNYRFRGTDTLAFVVISTRPLAHQRFRYELRKNESGSERKVHENYFIGTTISVILTSLKTYLYEPGQYVIRVFDADNHLVASAEFEYLGSL